MLQLFQILNRFLRDESMKLLEKIGFTLLFITAVLMFFYIIFSLSLFFFNSLFYTL